MASAHDAHGRELPPVMTNDNRLPAGTLENGALLLNLRARVGLWRPEGDKGPALRVESFGEDSGSLQVPAPLIRVPEGTEIVANIRNDLDVTLRVHGLCAHDGSPCSPVDIPAASRRDVRFPAGRPGTYHYWATTTGMPLSFRAPDAQLSGAFIVDPADAPSDSDRVLVITEWTSLTQAQLRELAASDDPGVAFLAMNLGYTFLINGLSWPATERLTYRVGEDVRWRVVNLSTQWHPMHLHGFYFDVAALGDGLRDKAAEGADRQRVVTQLLPPGGTMAMTWRAERAGNWLFHCHISDHVSPKRRLTEAPVADAAHHHGADDAAAGMAGMILGVTVVAADGTSGDPNSPAIVPPQKITLVMQTEARRYGAEPAYGFVRVDGKNAPHVDSVPVPGPTLALRRGEPVEITLVNRLPEATAIHWHGMELESYYDGVHGWSGAGTRVTPLIQPGESFTVRFTPPHAGTFMYHTHLHDDRQLTSGMYGALLVLEPDEAFDPTLDHVVVIGRAGPGHDAPAALNGDHEPRFVWKAGARHRIRFINITPGDIFVAALATADGPVSWSPISKDGAPVPPGQAAARPATQTIAVGETFDFEYDAPAGRQSLWMNVRTPAGRWQVQGRIVVK
jgi:manganese oxidase